jgi:hypothetical protein
MTHHFRNALFALCLAILPLTGLRADDPTPAPKTVAPTKVWIKSEIYFGRNLPDGRTVTEAEWKAFLDNQITPLFPKGLTVLEAYGQMEVGQHKIEKQATFVLLIVHPDDPAQEARLAELVKLYRETFGKVGIMRLNSVVTPQFIGP